MEDIMSRIPENDDYDRLHNLWRANLARVIKGKRGQAFLRELLAALEALPEKRLIEGAIAKDGCVCALGSLALKRRIDAGEDRDTVIAELAETDVDPYEGEAIWDWAERVLKAPSHLAWAIPNENDDDGVKFDWQTGRRTTVTPEQRYERLVTWVRLRIIDDAPAAEARP